LRCFSESVITHLKILTFFDRQSTNVRILINVEVELRRKALLDQNEWARKAENPGF
jgi:hypothetical protein